MTPQIHAEVDQRYQNNKKYQDKASSSNQEQYPSSITYSKTATTTTTTTTSTTTTTTTPDSQRRRSILKGGGHHIQGATSESINEHSNRESTPPPPPPPPSSSAIERSPKSSPRLKLRDSLRESFREMHMPKFLRKSASELSLVLEAMRGNISPTFYTQSTDRKQTSKSTGHLPQSKGKKRRTAIISWHKYSPQHINRQLHLGLYSFLYILSNIFIVMNTYTRISVGNHILTIKCKTHIYIDIHNAIKYNIYIH